MVGFDVDAVGNEWAFATVDCRESFFDSLLILSEISHFKASTLTARTAKHPAFFEAQKKTNRKTKNQFSTFSPLEKSKCLWKISEFDHYSQMLARINDITEHGNEIAKY